MEQVMLLLKYFYKEIIVVIILIVILIRLFYSNTKKKNKLNTDEHNKKHSIKTIETLQKEKLLGVLLIVASLIVLGIVMYYLIPFLLDYVLPKDN